LSLEIRALVPEIESEPGTPYIQGENLDVKKVQLGNYISRLSIGTALSASPIETLVNKPR
jgi:hypothetical protein